jgi:hypothetical protein
MDVRRLDVLAGVGIGLLLAGLNVLLFDFTARAPTYIAIGVVWLGLAAYSLQRQRRRGAPGGAGATSEGGPR